MNLLLIIACIGLIPHDPVIDDRADVIEVNRYFDSEANLVFTQVIFWGWHDQQDTFRVRAWRFLKQEMQIPQRDWNRRTYVTIWVDGAVMRRVQALAVQQTWSQFDPEVADRKFLPQHQRRGLSSQTPLRKHDAASP